MTTQHQTTLRRILAQVYALLKRCGRLGVRVEERPGGEVVVVLRGRLEA